MFRNNRHIIVAFFVSFFVTIALIFAMGACSSGSASTPSPNGTYKADGFEATVSDNSIQINLVDNDNSTLYWKGTFPATGENVTSDGDVEAMSQSILGSQDKTKTFVVDGDKITFKISMMGNTRTVHLKKV